mgnify:CR=1 FL=1
MTESNNITCKIFLAYHKPAALLKTDIFVPIHVGRDVMIEKNKDGILSNSSQKWLIDNLLGDNTGDNISIKNKNYCELTSQYWVWKNIDADYVGFMHYRRHLNFNESKNYETDCWGVVSREYLDNYYISDFKLDDNSIKQLLSLYDIVTVEPWNVKNADSKNNYDHYKHSDKKLHIENYDKALDILIKKYPDYKEDVDSYNSSDVGYYTNIFIMKKDIFNDYCKWLFDILFELERVSDISNYDLQEARIYGYISEWLFGIYIFHLKRVTELKIKELQRTLVLNTDIIQNPNNVNVCFSTDNNYAQHCAVAITSLLLNTKTNKNIDIYILNDGSLSHKNRRKISSLSSFKSGTKITFLDINKSLFKNLPIIKGSHFTEATYYRFVIPNLLNNINKIIYLDSDLVVNDDIENLYNINLSGNILGAVQDIIGRENQIRLNLDKTKYYCNAGVLVLDLRKMRQYKVSEKLFKWSNENIEKIKWQDQDIINVVLEDKIDYLDLSWNFQHFPDDTEKDFDTEEFEKAKRAPKIVHYIGHIKPWDGKIKRMYGDLYFKYLNLTPYKNYKIIYFLKLLKYQLLDNIFSIKNKKKGEKHYKVISFLGIKIRIHNRLKDQELRINKLEKTVKELSISIQKNEDIKR